jgi:PAP2 superfamily
VLYAWAFWPVRWMRPIALIANGAMLAATPIDGGHYFIDLFAGIAVAVLAVVAARALGRRLAAQRTVGESMAPVAGAAVPAE